jgi:hypothetical protein
VATIERRVDALEVSHGIGGGGGDCPGCGGPPDGEPGPNDTFELTFEDPEEAGENEWCEVCSRQTHVVLSWGDED